MHASSVRKAAVTFLSLCSAVVVAHCGSRTGLDIDGRDAGLQALACTTGTVTLARAIPAVMFTIDRSGSMGYGLGPRSGGLTRWEILTSAFAATLPPVDSSMQIGALLFPNAGGSRGTATCAVTTKADLALGPNHVAPLLDLLRTAFPGGATPTAEALDAAASLLLGVRAGTTARSVVLATDGAPNCNAHLDGRTCRCGEAGQGCQGASEQCLDDKRTIDTITKYRVQGLPTYVIGIQDDGDTEFSDVLNAMADAGGRALTGAAQHYYRASSQSEFDAALTAIRDQVGRCTYLTPSVPDANGSIGVELGNSELPYDPTGAVGWSWGNEANGEIVLAAAACAQAVSGGVLPTANIVCASDIADAASSQ